MSEDENVFLEMQRPYVEQQLRQSAQLPAVTHQTSSHKQTYAHIYLQTHIHTQIHTPYPFVMHSIEHAGGAADAPAGSTGNAEIFTRMTEIADLLVQEGVSRAKKRVLSKMRLPSCGCKKCRLILSLGLKLHSPEPSD